MRLFLLPPSHVRVHHLADDRARPDDGDLNHHVIKLLRAIARQRGHLRPALDLKHADRVSTLQRAIDLIIFGKLCEIDGIAIVLRNQFQTIFEAQPSCRGRADPP